MSAEASSTSIPFRRRSVCGAHSAAISAERGVSAKKAARSASDTKPAHPFHQPWYKRTAQPQALLQAVMQCYQFADAARQPFDTSTAQCLSIIIIPPFSMVCNRVSPEFPSVTKMAPLYAPDAFRPIGRAGDPGCGVRRVLRPAADMSAAGVAGRRPTRELFAALTACMLRIQIARRFSRQSDSSCDDRAASITHVCVGLDELATS